MIALKSVRNRTGLLKPVRHIRLMDNLFFSNLGVGGGKNRLVKTKLHLVARAVFATIILSTPVVFAGSELRHFKRSAASTATALVRNAPDARNPHRCSWVDGGCVR